MEKLHTLRRSLDQIRRALAKQIVPRLDDINKKLDHLVLLQREQRNQVANDWKGYESERQEPDSDE